MIPVDSKRAFYPQLDSLRCFAVISVMLGHWWHLLHLPFSFPFGLGVYLFFILSGFLIGSILLEQKEIINEKISESPGTKSKVKIIINALKIFYARRTLRIFPAYYAAIILIYLLKPADIAGHLPSLLTYTFNFRLCKIEEWPGLVTPFWSLSIEEQFYIFFPLLIFITPQQWIKKLLIVIIFAGILSKCIIHFLNYSPFDITMFTISSFDYLGIGMLVGFYKRYTNSLKKIIKHSGKYISISLMLFLVVAGLSKLYKSDFITYILMEFCFAVFATFCIIKCIYGVEGRGKKILEFKIFLFLGKISYGLYLFHMLISSIDVILINAISINKNFTWLANPLSVITIHFALTIILASISFWFFEQPINRLNKNFRYQVK